MLFALIGTGTELRTPNNFSTCFASTSTSTFTFDPTLADPSEVCSKVCGIIVTPTTSSSSDAIV